LCWFGGGEGMSCWVVGFGFRRVKNGGVRCPSGCWSRG